MDKCVKNCGQCPFFERFLEEYEREIGKKIGKGVCHKYKEDEVWETRTACGFAEQTPIDKLEKEAFLLIMQ